MDLDTSPFVFDGPVPPTDVIGRDRELAALRDRAHHGRFVLLHAPRRFGKTSLVNRLAADAALDRNLAVVVVDLDGVLTIDDIARRVEAAYRRLPQGRLRKAFVKAAAALAEIGVDLAAGAVGLSARLHGREREEATMVFERLAALPFEVGQALSVRVLVVLDEFQAIANVSNADAVLRSQIQHQREHVSYLFCGSEQGMLHALFADRARPLYGQAEQVALGPLEADALVDFVGRKFAETERDPGEALAPLIRLAGGHPQRAAFLAHHLWHVVGPGGAGDADAWSETRARAVRAGTAEFTAVWAALTDGQRRLVRLLAFGEPLYGGAARRLRLPKSSASAAARVLVARSVVGTDPYRLVDPLLAEWVRSHQPRP